MPTTTPLWSYESYPKVSEMSVESQTDDFVALYGQVHENLCGQDGPVLPFVVGFQNPPGSRAGASDVDGNLVLEDLSEHFFQRRAAEPVQLFHDGVFHQDDCF